MRITDGYYYNTEHFEDLSFRERLRIVLTDLGAKERFQEISRTQKKFDKIAKQYNLLMRLAEANPNQKIQPDAREVLREIVAKILELPSDQIVAEPAPTFQPVEYDRKSKTKRRRRMPNRLKKAKQWKKFYQENKRWQQEMKSWR